MKFYNRESELAELLRIKNLSFSEYSRMTVITGRRRIGKTSLIMRSTENIGTIFPHKIGREWIVSRNWFLVGD